MIDPGPDHVDKRPYLVPTTALHPPFENPIQEEFQDLCQGNMTVNQYTA